MLNEPNLGPRGQRLEKDGRGRGQGRGLGVDWAGTRLGMLSAHGPRCLRLEGSQPGAGTRAWPRVWVGRKRGCACSVRRAWGRDPCC